ncbi:MAG: cation transporter [Bdellovibrionaceae bacterium]|nr:cation transporter [Pseudobdellovibrionaceae bacterium]MBX3033890.1 cation transporter [Pseudobdellovibrionaceae bacterium]
MGSGHHHHHHGHSHGHSHDHAPGSGGGAMGRLGLVFALNLGFAILEVFGGFWTDSVAILSDALHDFGDAFAIGLTVVLERLSLRSSDKRYSYGYRRYSAAAALITGLVLALGSAWILSESVPRLWQPQAPHADGMLILAFLGVGVNGFAMWRVSKGTSLSEKMILWHLLEDVLGWVAVLIGAVVIKLTGWVQIDALLGCGIAIWILFNVLRNLRGVLSVFLQEVPSAVDFEALESKVRAVPGVCELHHSHLWSMDGDRHVFTAHLVVDASLSVAAVAELKKKVKTLLREDGVVEATLEVEPQGSDCVDPRHQD